MNTPRVRLTQIDGKLPNLALMRLSRFYKDRGFEVVFTRNVRRSLFEQEYSHVYGSSIFTYSQRKQETFLGEFPNAVIGGTGTTNKLTVEALLPECGYAESSDDYDYGLYPGYTPSIGFLQRGCRLRCKFCVVPQKEGKPEHQMFVDALWRGDGHPKHLHLLDNDFFGSPNWMNHVEDMTHGYKVCFNQGINIRFVNERAAQSLARIDYRDDQFKLKRIYTAWDNLNDEHRFFRGVDLLEEHGISPKHLMVYMLVGWAKDETWERIHYRFNKMVERGIKPYPMVFDRNRRDLCDFQRWAVRGYYRAIPFSEYDHNKHGRLNPKVDDRLTLFTEE